MNLKQSLLAATVAVLFATGAAQAQIVVHIGPPPPPPIVVVPPPPPVHPDWVWVAGFYRWNGHHYVWVPGHYVRPPHPGAAWVAGEWREERGGHVWHEGHWR